MAETGMPSAVGDAVADFVEQRCRAHLSHRGRADETVLARLSLVQDYRTARRSGREVTAGNIAYALLDGARVWRQDAAFDEGWLRWFVQDPIVPPADREG